MLLKNNANFMMHAISVSNWIQYKFGEVINFELIRLWHSPQANVNHTNVIVRMALYDIVPISKFYVWKP